MNVPLIYYINTTSILFINKSVLLEYIQLILQYTIFKILKITLLDSLIIMKNEIPWSGRIGGLVSGVGEELPSFAIQPTLTKPQRLQPFSGFRFDVSTELSSLSSVSMQKYEQFQMLFGIPIF